MLLSLGGIYDKWKGDGHASGYSCSIITLPPNKIVDEIHDRMPFILSNDQVKVWLDRSMDDAAFLSELVQPYPDEKPFERTVVATAG